MTAVIEAVDLNHWAAYTHAHTQWLHTRPHLTNADDLLSKAAVWDTWTGDGATVGLDGDHPTLNGYRRWLAKSNPNWADQTRIGAGNTGGGRWTAGGATSDSDGGKDDREPLPDPEIIDAPPQGGKGGGKGKKKKPKTDPYAEARALLEKRLAQIQARINRIKSYPYSRRIDEEVGRQVVKLQRLYAKVEARLAALNERAKKRAAESKKSMSVGDLLVKVAGGGPLLTKDVDHTPDWYTHGWVPTAFGAAQMAMRGGAGSGGGGPVKRAPRKATGGGESAAATIDRLRLTVDGGTLEGRGDAHDLLAGRSKVELVEIARELSIPNASRRTAPDLRDEIVAATVGRRLDSIATRGFTGLRPGAPEGMSAEEVLRRAARRATPTAPVKAAAPKAPRAPRKAAEREMEGWEVYDALQSDDPAQWKRVREQLGLSPRKLDNEMARSTLSVYYVNEPRPGTAAYEHERHGFPGGMEGWEVYDALKGEDPDAWRRAAVALGIHPRSLEPRMTRERYAVYFVNAKRPGQPGYRPIVPTKAAKKAVPRAAKPTPDDAVAPMGGYSTAGTFVGNLPAPTPVKPRRMPQEQRDLLAQAARDGHVTTPAVARLGTGDAQRAVEIEALTRKGFLRRAGRAGPDLRFEVTGKGREVHAAGAPPAKAVKAPRKAAGGSGKGDAAAQAATPTRARGQRRVAPWDPFPVYLDGGEPALRQRLATLDVEQLRDIVAAHGMDPARRSARWDRDRLAELVVARVRDRAAKGQAFRPPPRDAAAQAATVRAPRATVDVADVAARVRPLFRRAEIVKLLSDEGLKPTQLRELADTLGVIVPPNIKTKAALQKHIALVVMSSHAFATVAERLAEWGALRDEVTRAVVPDLTKGIFRRIARIISGGGKDHWKTQPRVRTGEHGGEWTADLGGDPDAPDTPPPPKVRTKPPTVRDLAEDLGVDLPSKVKTPRKARQHLESVIAAGKVDPAMPAVPKPRKVRGRPRTPTDILDRLLEDVHPATKRGQPLPDPHLTVWRQARADLDSKKADLYQVAERFTAHAAKLRGATDRDSQIARRVYTSAARQLNYSHHTPPDAPYELVDWAEQHGWHARTLRGVAESGDGGRYISVEVANPTTRERFTATWHTGRPDRTAAEHYTPLRRIQAGDPVQGTASNIRDLRSPDDLRRHIVTHPTQSAVAPRRGGKIQQAASRVALPEPQSAFMRALAAKGGTAAADDKTFPASVRDQLRKLGYVRVARVKVGGKNTNRVELTDAGRAWIEAQRPVKFRPNYYPREPRQQDTGRLTPGIIGRPITRAVESDVVKRARDLHPESLDWFHGWNPRSARAFAELAMRGGGGSGGGGPVKRTRAPAKPAKKTQGGFGSALAGAVDRLNAGAKPSTKPRIDRHPPAPKVEPSVRGNKVAELSTGEGFDWLGTPRRLRFVDGAGPIATSHDEHGQWLDVPRSKASARHLRDWYIANGSSYATERADRMWRQRMESSSARDAKVEVRDLGRGKLSSYDARTGTVVVDWRVMQLPRTLLDYAIVAGFARSESKSAPQVRATLDRIMPDWRGRDVDARQRLSEAWAGAVALGTSTVRATKKATPPRLVVPKAPSAPKKPKPLVAAKPRRIPQTRGGYKQPAKWEPGSQVTWRHYHEGLSTSQRTGVVWSSGPDEDTAWVIPDSPLPTDPYAAILVSYMDPKGRRFTAGQTPLEPQAADDGKFERRAREAAERHRARARQELSIGKSISYVNEQHRLATLLAAPCRERLAKAA